MKHTNGIGGNVSKLECVRRKLESTQLNAVRELLTDRAINRICNECGYFSLYFNLLESLPPKRLLALKPQADVSVALATIRTS